LDSRLAVLWDQLRNVYIMNKLWFEGELCFKQSLETAQRMTNFALAEFSFLYINLGLAYWPTDRFEEAKDTFKEGLKHRVAVFSQDNN
jgi:tetratricopeptide (TPR) repeat protein